MFGAILPFFQVLGAGAAAYRKGQLPPRAQPNLPGPTDAEVLASDLRLRRQLMAASGRRSTVITGGLGDRPARLTMPTLIGT